MPSVDRGRLLAELTELSRDNAALGLALHQSIAERFGLGPTDLKCLDLARHEQHLTAGRLAELTGLSTSAITAALDRLERGGFVERQRDPADRRKVIVAPRYERAAELGAAYEPIAKAFGGALDDFTDAELEVIIRYTRRVNAAARELARRR
jgi:DNA-binding MarR family transcriptional regulator